MNDFIKEFEIFNKAQHNKIISSLVSTLYRKLDHEYGRDIRKMSNKINWLMFKDSLDLALIEMQ